MISLQNSMEPNAAWFLMETESTAGALVHSALAIKGDRKISYWILKNITFPFTTTNLQYNCGMGLLSRIEKNGCIILLSKKTLLKYPGPPLQNRKKCAKDHLKKPP